MDGAAADDDDDDDDGGDGDAGDAGEESWWGIGNISREQQEHDEMRKTNDAEDNDHEYTGVGVVIMDANSRSKDSCFFREIEEGIQFHLECWA